jgi:hypothetical protein
LSYNELVSLYPNLPPDTNWVLMCSASITWFLLQTTIYSYAVYPECLLCGSNSTRHDLREKTPGVHQSLQPKAIRMCGLKPCEQDSCFNVRQLKSVRLLGLFRDGHIHEMISCSGGTTDANSHPVGLLSEQAVEICVVSALYHHRVLK